MRRSNTQSLGEALRSYIKEMRMERKLKEVDVVQSWEEALGKTIARYTRNIYLSKGILFVEVSSPVVKNELLMMREDIRKRLNDLAGEEMVTKIVFK
jgi:predicted nucleic acid-binding Zn ribbon protein